MSNKSSSTLEIIGLILGIIAILFAFIPCLGSLAFIPGLIGLILGVIAFVKAKDDGNPKGMSIAVIAVSIIACLISVFQIFLFGNMASDIKGEMKTYETCEELEADYKKTSAELKQVNKEMQSDSPSFGAIKSIARLSTAIGNMKEQAIDMDCDIEIENFDPSDFDKDIEEPSSKETPKQEDDSMSQEEG